MNECFSCQERKRVIVFEMVDVLDEGKSVIKDDSKVLTVWGGGAGGVDSGEVEVLGCQGEGIYTNSEYVYSSMSATSMSLMCKKKKNHKKKMFTSDLP